MMEHLFKSAEAVLTKKSVNSKRLFDEINSFVMEGIVASGIMWASEPHRHAFVEVVDELLENYAKEGQIEQWKIVCDYRNNNTTDMNAGKHKLEIRYKQKNCLNTTILLYDIKDLA